MQTGGLKHHLHKQAQCGLSVNRSHHQALSRAWGQNDHSPSLLQLVSFFRRRSEESVEHPPSNGF